MIAMISRLVALVASLAAAPPVAPRPRLVVVITVDQLRPDYLDRYRPQLKSGLAMLLKQGAVFTEAYHDHAITETAPGHATILSGRWPAHTGIIRNLAGVQDSATSLIGVTGIGASPARFRGTELFDWLKAAEPAARALSVSGKDRGAILPIGRAKEQVYCMSPACSPRAATTRTRCRCGCGCSTGSAFRSARRARSGAYSSP